MVSFIVGMLVVAHGSRDLESEAIELGYAKYTVTNKYIPRATFQWNTNYEVTK